MAKKTLESVPDSDEIDTSGLPPTADEREWEYEIDRAVYEKPIPLDQSIFTPVGLVLDMGDMEYSEWARIGANLDRIAKGHQWWGGDWCNMGEAKWDDEIWQVLDEFAASTLKNWGLTCGAFPIEDRIEGVDFTHFKYAADLRTPAMRRKCIRLVVEDSWTTAETLAYVKEKNGGNDEKEKAAKGETTSITFSLGWNLAPADEEAGDRIATQVMEFVEQVFLNEGVEARALNAPNKTYNES